MGNNKTEAASITQARGNTKNKIQFEQASSQQATSQLQLRAIAIAMADPAQPPTPLHSRKNTVDGYLQWCTTFDQLLGG